MLNIIIPVYNAEKTIGRTLSSLVAQTNKKFIVTIVDDCSTDNSLNIIKKFKKDLRLRIISLEINGGVGNARQVGLDSNECDLICFLDSDDMFMPYTVSLYLREMLNDFPEVLYTNFISEQKGQEVVLNGKEYITWFHGKCYRKDFLEKFNIKIPIVRYNEDSGFSTTVNELATKKVYVPEITYFWSENPNSITRSGADFKEQSMPNFVKSIHYSFSTISNSKTIQSIPIFYGQIYNFYSYYQRALYNEEKYTQELKKEIQSFFNEFWIEAEIRPNLLVFAFNQPSPIKDKGVITSQSTAEWLSEMSGIKYTAQDFRVEEEEKNE